MFNARKDIYVIGLLGGHVYVVNHTVFLVQEAPSAISASWQSLLNKLIPN